MNKLFTAVLGCAHAIAFSRLFVSASYRARFFPPFCVCFVACLAASRLCFETSDFGTSLKQNLNGENLFLNFEAKKANISRGPIYDF